MAAPVIGQRNRFAPGRNALIDRSHPLAQRLVFFFAPGVSDASELAYGRSVVKVGSTGLTGSRYGLSGSTLATASGYRVAGVPDADCLGPISLAWFGRIDTAPTSRVAFLTKFNATQNTPFDLSINANQRLQILRSDATNRGQYEFSPTLAVNETYGFVVTQASSDQTVIPIAYINGGPSWLGTLVGGTGGSVTGSGIAVNVGIRNDGTLGQPVTTAMAAVWARSLTSAEAAALYADPFCFLKV